MLSQTRIIIIINNMYYYIIIIVIIVISHIRRCCCTYIQTLRRPENSHCTYTYNNIYLYVYYRGGGNNSRQHPSPIRLIYDIICTSLFTRSLLQYYIYYLFCYSLARSHHLEHRMYTAVYGHTARVCVWPIGWAESGGLRHIIIFVCVCVRARW